MKLSKAALMAVLIGGGSLVLLDTAPAEAQVLESLRNRQRGRQAQQQERQPEQARVGELSREESAAIMPLYQAVQAQDWTTASASLPAAQAGARSPYGRYVVGQLQLEIGRGTQNTQIQAQAVDSMLASGGAPAETLPQLLGVQAAFAIQSSNFAAAEGALTRLTELAPNDVERIEQLAFVKARLNKRDESLTLYRRALQLRQAAGQAVPEESYRRMLAVAYEGRMAQPAIELTRTLITAYPTPTNWHDSLLIYRELGGVSGAAELDLRRLMRAAQALTSERDYVEYAFELSEGGLPGEAKAVLDDGISRGVIRANHPDVARLLAAANARIAEDRASLAGSRTRALAAPNGRSARIAGDAYFSYGQFAEAAELYRAALQKGGEDANLVNTRLGASLALAGQRAEAEAAFRAVTGPRADLAQYWLIWLSRRPA